MTVRYFLMSSCISSEPFCLFDSPRCTWGFLTPPLLELGREALYSMSKTTATRSFELVQRYKRCFIDI